MKPPRSLNWPIIGLTVLWIVLASIYVVACNKSEPDLPYQFTIPPVPPVHPPLDTNGHIIQGQGAVFRPITADSYRTNAKAGWEAGIRAK